MRIIILIPLFFIVGCTSNRTCADVAASAEVIYNASASLPDSPQTRAIKANAAAISKAVGHPMEIKP